MSYKKPAAVVALATIGLLQGCSMADMDKMAASAGEKWDQVATKVNSMTGNSSSSNDHRWASARYEGADQSYIDFTPLVSRYNAVGVIDYCKAKGYSPEHSDTVRRWLVEAAGGEAQVTSSKHYNEGRNGTVLRQWGTGSQGKTKFIRKPVNSPYSTEIACMSHPETARRYLLAGLNGDGGVFFID